MKSSIQKEQHYRHRGPYFLWVKPAANGLSMPTFAFTGNDPRSILNDWTPRPTDTTWIHIGDTRQLAEECDENLKPEDAFRSKVPEDLLIEEETNSVECDTLFNGDPILENYFRQVSNQTSPGRGSSGVGRRKSKYALLILRVNENQLPSRRYYYARLYYRGIFLASPIPAGYRAESLKMSYRALIGKDANGCDRRAPGQTLEWLYFAIDNSGNNVQVNPADPTAILTEVQFPFNLLPMGAP